MLRFITKQTISLGLMALAMALGGLIVRTTTAPITSQDPSVADRQVQSTSVPTATETVPPYTPLPSLTPSRTLLPPPTFEPPTLTPIPTQPPSSTPTPTVEINVSIPGLHGAETPTPSTTPGCEPREDWELTYTVQRDDALSIIAQRYNTTVDAMVAANCLKDKNLIVIGQKLRVPGTAHPEQPAVECAPFELLTPINGAVTIPGDGLLTFNWRGPMAPRNLIRFIRPDGSIYERLVELRQNEIINMTEFLRPAGTYTWYVYPLGTDYLQIPCHEGGPWTFTKGEAAPIAAAPASSSAASAADQPAPSAAVESPSPTEIAPPAAAFNADVTTGVAPLTVSFANLSTGEISGVAWDFGDGTTGSEQNPIHTYSTAGSYTVTLTASGPGGSTSAASTITVTEAQPLTEEPGGVSSEG